LTFDIYYMSWFWLGSLLKKRIKQLNLKKPLEKELVCQSAEKVLKDIFFSSSSFRYSEQNPVEVIKQSEEFYSIFKVINFKNNCLILRCSNFSWANEVKLREEEIIKKLNQNFKKDIVKKIKCLVE